MKQIREHISNYLPTSDFPPTMHVRDRLHPSPRSAQRRRRRQHQRLVHRGLLALVGRGLGSPQRGVPATAAADARAAGGGRREDFRQRIFSERYGEVSSAYPSSIFLIEEALICHQNHLHPHWGFPSLPLSNFMRNLGFDFKGQSNSNLKLGNV